MRCITAVSMVTLLFVFLAAPLPADDAAPTGLKPAHIFQDNMVLQQGVKVPVWGWAAPETKVTVQFAGQTQTAAAGKDGYWRVNLTPLKASAKPEILKISGGGKNWECKDVLVGEVWFCAGQSNIARGLGTETSQNPRLKERVGETDFPQIRFIVYSAKPSDTPLKDRNGNEKWQILSKATAGRCMAMPFFFARKIHQELNVPVGLIEVAVSGTPQTAWTAREVLDQVAKEADGKMTYENLLKSANGDNPQKRKAKPSRYPSVLYNGQVHPLAPFAFRGLLWHQGEAGPSGQHAERMVALVNHWRKLFERDFVYLWGALGRNTTSGPPLAPRAAFFYRSGRNLQFLDAQKRFGYGGKSAYCDFFDLGNTDTHWGEKDKGGERFAKAALTLAYDKPQVFTGPQLIKSEVKDGEIRLTFTRVGSGLVYKPSINGISGFLLESGKDVSWVTPTVDGKDTLVFKDKKITPASNLFYAFHSNPHETLFNKEGFPASMFRAKPGRFPRTPGGAPLATFIKKDGAGVKLNITHVRRNVIVLSAVTRKGDGVNRVKALVPKEWNAVAAQHDGKPVDVAPAQSPDSHWNAVELDVTTNAGPYIIYNKAKAAEALAEADLSRF